MIKWTNAIPAAFFVATVVLWLPAQLRAIEQAASAPASRPQTQEAAADVEKLTLHPSATTQPALQYRLLPELLDQTPGNAWPLYAIAVDLLPTAPPGGNALDDLWRRADEKEELPLEQLAHDQEAEEILKDCSQTFRYVDLAARREDVYWDAGLREFGGDAIMPYLNQLRGITTLMSVRVRLQMGQGDLEGALRTMQSMFSISRQLNRRPTLVEGLVAMGIAHVAFVRGVQAWIGIQNSPNLYWALSSLPRSFTNYRGVAQTERSYIYFQFPALRQAARGQELSAGQWREIMRGLIHLDEAYRPRPASPPSTPAELDDRLNRLVAAAMPQARQYLVSTGMPKEKAEALSPERAVGVYFFHEYRIASDEIWKAFELPYRQSIDVIRQANERAEQEAATGAQNPFLSLGQGTWRAKCNFADLDRRIALLRTLEALRDYLARHGGRLPHRLDQITDVPLPIDPVTDAPFSYRCDGQTAILEASPQEGRPRSGWRFEITIAK